MSSAARSGSENRVTNLVKRLYVANRKAFIAVTAVLVILFCGFIDFAANSGKAYGGVSIGGIDVGGLTEEQVLDKLQSTYGERIRNSEILVFDSATYTDDQSLSRSVSGDAQDESVPNTADEEWTDAVDTAPEYGAGAKGPWYATQASTGASAPLEELAHAALAVGREDGGVLGRLGLIFGGRDLPIEVDFDEDTLERFLKQIDDAIGDPRVDATVIVEDGIARAQDGHDGMIVDRDWIEGELALRMLSDEGHESTLTVEPVEAPARISLSQAEVASEKVNRAIVGGARFSYEGALWEATRSEVGSWVKARTVETDKGFDLAIEIDQDRATAALVENIGAKVSTEGVTVVFEESENGILVHPSGTTRIPDMVAATDKLQEALFGEEPETGPEIVISQTDAPDTLTFNQALSLGIITVLGEYTTWYSNEEGTENRNHNIHLVSDIINNSIVSANGGTWSFNDTSGDTNQDPPFASAGSIVEGEYVDSIGGGICQVATTVFNAVYEAGLDIPIRYNHTLYLANYPDGRDASVSYPDLDLQWVNDLDSDVILCLTYDDTSVTAKIYGVETGYVVTTEDGTWEDGEKYETQFEHDDSLADGTYYLKTSGIDGSKYSVTRTVNDANGNLVSVKTFASLYQPKDEVYVVGPDVDTEKLERDTSEDDSNNYDPYSEGVLYWQEEDEGSYVADESGWYGSDMQADEYADSALGY